MFRNMVTSLIEEGRITTTITKAKQLRGIAEKMVTLAKKGTLHARRQAARYVRSNKAVQKLFSELGPRFKQRPGGYTHVLKLGFRRGDGADMALIEYLGYEPKAVSKEKTVEEKPEGAPKTKAKAKKSEVTSAKSEKKKEVKATHKKETKTSSKSKKSEK
jgi:large subunit ribosomal protein L17